MTKATVITCSFNRPIFLRQAIDSIKSQTMRDWQMIIIDDFSTNSDVPNVLKWAEEDARIKVIRMGQNINNIARFWNIGLSYAVGEHVAFLDDDNEKMPNFFEKMCGALDAHPEWAAVTCFNAIINDAGGQISTHDAPRIATRQTMQHGNQIDSGEIVIRRNIFDQIGWFDEKCITSEDWELIRRIINLGTIGCVQEILARYRVHAANRIKQSAQLGDGNTLQYIASKNYLLGRKYGVTIITPPYNKLTHSQQTVCNGMLAAAEGLQGFDIRRVYSNTFKHDDTDAVIVIAPFVVVESEMNHIKACGKPVMSIHMEDPAAFKTNILRVAGIPYVATNDRCTLPQYKGTGSQTIVCPSLGISPAIERLSKERKCSPKYDAIFCGYAYESRKQWMKEFFSSPIEFNMLVVGDGWETENLSCEVRKTQTEEDTFNLYLDSEIVVCVQRKNGDLNISGEVAQTMCRGHIEMYSGAYLLIDDTRKHTSFIESTYATFSSAADCRNKITELLKDRESIRKSASIAQKYAASTFTFSTRLQKLFEIIRSNRSAIDEVN